MPHPTKDAQRADLEARIARACDALALADRSEADARKYVEILRAVALVKAGTKRGRRAAKDANKIERTIIAKDVPATRASANAVLQALQAELDGLTGPEELTK